MEDRDNIASLTLEVLRSIRGELGALRGDMNSKFDALRGEMNAMRTELRDDLSSLRDDMNVGFKAVLQQADRRFIDHEGRLRRIEDHLGFD